MKMLFVFALLLMSHLCSGQKSFDEWQSGVDIQTAISPPFATASISFIRKFTEVPKVLVAFEYLEFAIGRVAELSATVSDITVHGFKLRYKVGQQFKKLKTRWVAMYDPLVEVQYLQFDSLNNLAFGRQRLVSYV